MKKKAFKLLEAQALKSPSHPRSTPGENTQPWSLAQRLVARCIVHEGSALAWRLRL